MAYSTQSSYKTTGAYGNSGSKGYNLSSEEGYLNRLVNKTENYMSADLALGDKRYQGYKLPIGLGAVAIYLGQEIYERLVRSRREEIKPYKREVKLMDIKDVPEMRVLNIGSFLPSALGSISKTGSKGN